ARSNCSCVHSGASSGSSETRLEARFFAGIAFPHRNHVAIRATRGPNHHDQTPSKEPVSLESRLAIVKPVILKREGCSGEHRGGFLDQAPLGQRLSSLAGVIGDPHKIYMPTLNAGVKIFRGHEKSRRDGWGCARGI